MQVHLIENLQTARRGEVGDMIVRVHARRKMSESPKIEAMGSTFVKELAAGCVPPVCGAFEW